MVRNRSAAGVIWVRTVAVLLPGRGSGSCAETPAFATTVPKAEGEVLTRVAMATVALLTLPSEPTLQVTLAPLTATEPWDGFAEMKLTLAGNKFVAVTKLAAEGP